jgi:transcriptional regulator with XRE-family HTH domain
MTRNGHPPVEKPSMARETGELRPAVKHLVREILFLPEEERAQFFKWLREDLSRFGLEEHASDQLNQRMQDARAALRRVVAHLGLTETEDQLALKMREFNAAPEKARGGWTARRIADAHKSSWGLAKQVAFTSASLPVSDAQDWTRMRHLPRHGRSSELHLIGVREWLDTKPKKKTVAAYDNWRGEQNEVRREHGQLPLVTAQTIVQAWHCSWPDLIEAVARDEAPSSKEIRDEPADGDPGQPSVPTGEPGEGEPGDEPGEGEPRDVPSISDLRELPVAAPKDLTADPALRARRTNVARRAMGLTPSELSLRAGLNDQFIGRLELGRTDKPGYEKMLALSGALGLSLDYFATDDGRDGFPSETERDVHARAKTAAVSRARKRERTGTSGRALAGQSADDKRKSA